MVEARENTNQQTLRLLEKMYDDLKPLRPNIDTIMDEATALPPNMLQTFLLEMMGRTPATGKE